MKQSPVTAASPEEFEDDPFLRAMSRASTPTHSVISDADRWANVVLKSSIFFHRMQWSDVRTAKRMLPGCRGEALLSDICLNQ